MGALGLLKGLSLKDLAPEAPAIANYTTGEVMGHSSDRLAAKFGVSRADQDELAVRSHLNAAKAHAEGLYKDEIIPVDGKVAENGIKGDSSIEKVSKLSKWKLFHSLIKIKSLLLPRRTRSSCFIDNCFRNKNSVICSI
jgi:hypothetical protein